ncbi:V-ATPase subunit H [Rhizoctonia solani]|uniref:V-ATPase subunit H n=1 Tax=Rhizoctonia solani TaxID=456999 RepID=A0A8H7I800_9AGAM|nr:V-ATPase subunit H [Rhizoctonia solani]
MADHLLALKVMRVSRPSLSAHPLPFFSDSTALAAHARASPLSLESQPLDGIPSTLRDLAQSQVLLLPEAFGSISLGETFTSRCTASTKTVLGQVGGIDSRLEPGQMFSLVVSHEMKELGQHVLVCTVGYHVPPALRNNSIPPEDPIHIPRSPSALLNRNERNKVFLEVHVQNLTTKPLYFEKIQFECAEGWVLADANPKSVSNSGSESDSGSKTNETSLRPQDTRQYLYILVATPAATPSFPIPYPPGTIIALGRLDMSWRSSFGEPGRLLTSMLSRKIPLPPAPQPAPAIPLHLQQQRQQTGRPGSPVPYKPRTGSMSRPMSPGPVPASGTVSLASAVSGSVAGTVALKTLGGAAKDVQVDLVVTEIPSTIYLDRPFKIKCSVGALLLFLYLPPTSSSTPRPKHQKNQPDRLYSRSNILTILPSVRYPSNSPANGAGSSLSPSPLVRSDKPGRKHSARRNKRPRSRPDLGTLLQSDLGQPTGLPPPYSDKAPIESPVFLGPSSRVLEPVVISEPAPMPTEGPLVQLAKKEREGKGEGWVDVELEFVAVKGVGIVRIGGVRVFGEGGVLLGEWDVLGEFVDCSQTKVDYLFRRTVRTLQKDMQRPGAFCETRLWGYHVDIKIVPWSPDKPRHVNCTCVQLVSRRASHPDSVEEFIMGGTYQRAGQISTEDLSQLKKIDKQPPSKLNSVLMGEGPQYAFLFTSILKKLARTEPTQAVLVMIGDALIDHEERVGLFLRTSDQDPELPFDPLVKALDSMTNSYGSSLHRSSQHSWLHLQTPPPEHVITPFLHKLSVNIHSSSPNAQDVSLQCLAALLSIRSARSLAWQNQNREIIRGLVKILKGPPVPVPQTAYLAGYAMWLLSFDQAVAEGINTEFDVIPVLVGIAQGAGKEKVIRTRYDEYGQNLATKAPTANLPSMLVAKLLPFCKNLATRKWTDEEILDDITFLRDLLQQNFESLTTYDEYTSELASGHLSWSPVHESEAFWKENAARLDEKDFAQLKRLVELLKTSQSSTVLAVAAHDLGQYVKHHDRGKKYVVQLSVPLGDDQAYLFDRAVTKLGGKARVMELMSHPDADVRYRALLSVQRLVSTPWVVA